jgi:hypothetical protein
VLAVAAASAGQRTRADLAGDAAQLYMQGRRYADIGTALDLRRGQAEKILRELFAEGMPKLARHMMSDEQVRAIHAVYVRGYGSIERVAESIGFTGSTARRRIRALKLPLEREKPPRNPARSRAHAEQRVTTALLMARIDELRKPRALSLERLAGRADVPRGKINELRTEFSDPPLSTVLRLCRGLDITAGELLNDLPVPIEARPRHARRPALVGEHNETSRDAA